MAWIKWPYDSPYRHSCRLCFEPSPDLRSEIEDRRRAEKKAHQAQLEAEQAFDEALPIGRSRKWPNQARIARRQSRHARQQLIQRCARGCSISEMSVGGSQDRVNVGKFGIGFARVLGAEVLPSISAFGTGRSRTTSLALLSGRNP